MNKQINIITGLLICVCLLRKPVHILDIFPLVVFKIKQQSSFEYTTTQMSRKRHRLPEVNV